MEYRIKTIDELTLMEAGIKMKEASEYEASSEKD